MRDPSLAWINLPVNQTLYTSAMELQNACDGNTFGPYCEDRAHSTEDHNLQTLWTFLAALSNKQGRREFVRILGYGAEGSTSKESRTSVTSNEVTQLTNIMSSMNSSLPRKGLRVKGVDGSPTNVIEQLSGSFLSQECPEGAQ
ncbi:hypothetical protein NECAME_12387 [Necator americanus]|uniref:Uncharacterized protein n=1 Tax=Necator americanus TaxID=51031 RepID=W2T095_NECAM|nr:hypothetical protein NECAME_12387 [Necator americanus]ETN75430.1 hypothetical protein NECAME_12387 [Necator americanus]